MRGRFRLSAVVVLMILVGCLLTPGCGKSKSGAPSELGPGPSRTNSIGDRMIPFPSTSFLMGSPENEGGRKGDEGPQHRVTIRRNLMMGSTEITQGQWKRVMSDAPSQFSSCGENCPVENVSWFCNKLSDLEKLGRCYTVEGEKVSWDPRCMGYRLPTEAEWEYAARAMSTTAVASGPVYSVGDQCAEDMKVSLMGWYCESSNKQTHPVAKLQANFWGMYDMYGNVSEWVWDWYAEYQAAAAVDPPGPASGAKRVVRGGNWSDLPRDCRSAARAAFPPGDRKSTVGFRVIRMW